MILRPQLLAGMAIAASLSASADPGARLGIAAQPAVVPIRLLREGRQLVHLPALEYALEIEAHCGEGGVARSVSISVNDTQMTLHGDQLTAGAGNPVSLTIPARQVAPVAVTGYCMSGAPDTHHDTLLIRDTVTVHASLRCNENERDSITYAAEGLDVTLRCEAPESDQSDAEMDR
jgi:hypothetical protein